MYAAIHNTDDILCFNALLANGPVTENMAYDYIVSQVVGFEMDANQRVEIDYFSAHDDVDSLMVDGPRYTGPEADMQWRELAILVSYLSTLEDETEREIVCGYVEVNTWAETDFDSLESAFDDLLAITDEPSDGETYTSVAYAGEYFLYRKDKA